MSQQAQVDIGLFVNVGSELEQTFSCSIVGQVDHFNEAIILTIECENQKLTYYYSDELSFGGVYEKSYIG